VNYSFITGGYMEICFLCTGNASRSPMAEVIAKRELGKLGLNWIVYSRGTRAIEGEPISRRAEFVCSEIGLNISGKRRKRLDNDIVNRNMIFVVMESQHITELTELFGISEDRIYMLGNGIPDPCNCDIEVYRSCRDKIAAEIQNLIRILKHLE
jgi:protein-tyrosine-phosphatase